MPRTSLALVRAWRERGVGGCQNTAVHNLQIRFSKIPTRSNHICGQRWGLLEQIFTSVVSRARGDVRKRRTGPPGNTSCFSVVLRMATCEREIAKTGRRSISEHGIGRSHQDLAIRSLESWANADFAQNTAAHDPVSDATHKSSTCSGVA